MNGSTRTRITVLADTSLDTQLLHRDYFSNESLKSDLGGKAIRGGAWVGIAQLATVAVGLLCQPVLARLLDPEDFGLIAYAAVFTGFAMLLIDSGFTLATVQRAELSHEQASNMFWASFGLAAVACFAVVLVALVFGLPFDDGRLGSVLIVQSAAFIFSGLTIQHQALLQRGMRFGALAATRTIGFLVSSAITVAWAWWFFRTDQDYWALVAGPLAGGLCTLIACWLLSGWVPSLPQRNAGTRPLIEFGTNLAGANFLNYVVRNADKLMIGSYCGDVPLGYYDRAFRLLLFPLQNVVAPLGSVVIPALSRLGDDQRRLVEAYSRVLRLLLWTIVPAMAVAAVITEWLVLFVMGDKWGEAVPVFRWLALVAVLQPINNSTSWLFTARGRANALFRLGLVSLPILLITFALGLPYGAQGVAMAYAISGPLVRFPLLLWWLRKFSIINPWYLIEEIIRAVPVVVALTVVNAVLVFLLNGSPPWVGLAVSASVSLIVWVALLWIMPAGRVVVRELSTILDRLMGRTKAI